MSIDLMQVAPALPPPRPGRPVPRTVLLVNPFYPKDVNASFGKHVLTPTLALTSLAGATPPGWKLRYWDENLLQGAPSLRADPAGGGHQRAPDLRQRGPTSWRPGSAPTAAW